MTLTVTEENRIRRALHLMKILLFHEDQAVLCSTKKSNLHSAKPVNYKGKTI